MAKQKQEREELKLPDYLKIMEVLKDIDSGNQDKNYGMCRNLYKPLKEVVNPDLLVGYIQYVLKSFFGKDAGQYPIEGDYHAFKANNHKWDSSTAGGAKRLEFLAYFIEQCSTKIGELENEIQN